jgi:hypothetical protein
MANLRVIAIDLRSRAFGFAILEGPHTLLTFGRKLCRVRGSQNRAAVGKKIAILLHLFAPSVLVLKRTSGRADRTLATSKEATAAIKHQAKLQSIRVVVLRRRDIYRAFQRHGATSKYKIATLIAQLFPEIEWQRPPGRRNWEPEHHRMAVFDAISIALAYYSKFEHVIEAGEITSAGRDRA